MPRLTCSSAISVLQVLLSPYCPFKLGPRTLAQLLDDFIFHNLSVFHIAKGLRFAALSFCLKNPMRCGPVAYRRFGCLSALWLPFPPPNRPCPWVHALLVHFPSFLCMPAEDDSDKVPDMLLDASACRRASSYCSSLPRLKSGDEVRGALQRARNLDQLNVALAQCLHGLALGALHAERGAQSVACRALRTAGPFCISICPGLPCSALLCSLC